MTEYVGEHINIRDAVVCVEKRKGVIRAVIRH